MRLNNIMEAYKEMTKKEKLGAWGIGWITIFSLFGVTPFLIGGIGYVFRDKIIKWTVTRKVKNLFK